jgi:hypothetical protein
MRIRWARVSRVVMAVRRVVSVAALSVAGTLTVGCDTGPEDAEPIIEPHATIGEPVDYRSLVDTDGEWVVTVTIEDVECDIDIVD